MTKEQKREVLYRAANLKDMLLTRGYDDNSLYGIDEWSTPIVILNRLVRYIEDIDEQCNND